MVRSVTVREPEWSEDQVALLLASRRLDVRGSHGHLLEESIGTQANPGNTNGTHFYVPGPVEIDHAEKVRLDAWEALREEHGKDANLNGFHIPVIRVERKPTPSSSG